MLSATIKPNYTVMTSCCGTDTGATGRRGATLMSQFRVSLRCAGFLVDKESRSYGRQQRTCPLISAHTQKPLFMLEIFDFSPKEHGQSVRGRNSAFDNSLAFNRLNLRRDKAELRLLGPERCASHTQIP
jgi:hypothetical protein